MWIPGSILGATDFSKKLLKTSGTLDEGGGGGLKGSFLDTTQGQRNEKYNKNQPFK